MTPDEPTRVGILLTSPEAGLKDYIVPFKQELDRLRTGKGKVEYVLEAPPADNVVDAPGMQALAKKLIARAPKVIWVISTPSATAAYAETRTIPIVGSAVSNVLKHELVQDLAKPGTNFTGIVNQTYELGDQRFLILKALMPELRKVGVLVSSKSLNCEQELEEIKAAAGAGTMVVSASMDQGSCAEEAVSKLKSEGAEAVIVPHFNLFQQFRQRIISQATADGMPVVGHRHFFVDDGALVSFSSNLAEQMRQSAQQVDRVLDGAKPADIPVESPQAFELALNRSAMARFKVTLPPIFSAKLNFVP